MNKNKKKPIEIEETTKTNISNCNFTSNDKYDVNFADSINALAKAVQDNAKAIQDICNMITSSGPLRSAFVYIKPKV